MFLRPAFSMTCALFPPQSLLLSFLYCGTVVDCRCFPRPEDFAEFSLFLPFSSDFSFLYCSAGEEHIVLLFFGNAGREGDGSELMEMNGGRLGLTFFGGSGEPEFFDVLQHICTWSWRLI
eukprot:RCo014154